MKKLFLLAILATIPFITGVKTADAQVYDAPTWILAPSINLFSPIEGVGVNDKGEMDVPEGHTNTVGWFEQGVKPGEAGTAVLDAHVFAAFKNLDKVRPGEYIFVFMDSGEILSFMVKEANFYSLNALSPHTLFEPTNTSRKLNLITCAGNWNPFAATYDHRLIVSAELV